MIEDIARTHRQCEVVPMFAQIRKAPMKLRPAAVTAARCRSAGRTFELRSSETPSFAYPQIETDETGTLADIPFYQRLPGEGESVEITIRGVDNVGPTAMPGRAVGCG